MLAYVFEILHSVPLDDKMKVDFYFETAYTPVTADTLK